MANTITSNLNLVLPATGQTNWGNTMNANLSAIDSAHGTLSAFNKLNKVTNASGTLNIDLSQGRVIHIELSGNVTAVNLTGLTDGYITFHIVQPPAGGLSFAWPAVTRNAGEISAQAGTATGNTISMQSFAYNTTLGAAYAVGPLMTGGK